MAKQEAEIRLQITFNPPTEDFPYWTAIYPELDLATQGETLSKAKENAIEALIAWMECVVSKGKLVEVLTECGFTNYRIKQLEKDVRMLLPQRSAHGKVEQCHA